MRTKFELIDDVWERDIHGPFVALPVRQGEPVRAQLVVTKNNNGERSLHDLPVWRISPAGIEIINTANHLLPLHEDVSLEVRIGSDLLKIDGHVERKKEIFSREDLIGIVYSLPATRVADTKLSPSRTLTRWTCHPLFYPTGTMNNPGRFADHILFTVLEVSRKGMRIATSLRNKLLLRGLNLKGQISFPMGQKVQFRARIVSSQINERNGVNVQIVGLNFTEFGPASISALGRYIIKFGTSKHCLASPKRLRSEGYGHIDVAEAIEWDFVRTEAEYKKVLDLRRIAYRSVVGWPVDDDDHLIADPFDERARIVIGRFRDTAVATLRICFHEKGDTFEEELYINFPDDFPDRDTLVEASRAAIHPEFRGSEIFMDMMRFSMLTGLQAERHWFVQSTYDYLSPIYSKIGFKKVGGGWMHPQLVGRKMQMFIVNAHHVLHARHGNPFLYNAVVPQIEAFLDSKAFTKLSFREQFKLKLWRLTAPVFLIYSKLQQRKHHSAKKTKRTKKF